MKARANSTQLKAQKKEFNDAYDADGGAVSIRVLSDGRIAYGDGSPLSYADAHKLITSARTTERTTRKDKAGKNKAERIAAKRAKLEARAAGIAAALEALGADAGTVTA